VRPHHASGYKTPLQFLKARGIIDDVKFLYLSYMSWTYTVLWQHMIILY